MYLYSNILGTFVFNQNFQIREKTFFRMEEIPWSYNKLSKGELLESEKRFLEKFKSITDLRKAGKVKAMQRAFDSLKEYREEFRKANLYLTRMQIRESISDDLLIIQVSSSIEEISKTANLLSKRMREWYSYSNPEIEKIVGDHRKLAEKIAKEGRGGASKDSMGKELEKDIEPIKRLASLVITLYKEKDSKELYLESIMKRVCPNLNEVAGSLIGAKLIAQAGSLKNLVMMPASTIQLLGAEKALFKHMLNKKILPPKHGLIIEHPLLQKAKKDRRGKVARALADKISVSVKVDYFKGEFIGDKLKKELEDRLR